MKIVSWNCKNEYYKKICFDENKEKLITKENDDAEIFIIQECTYSDCIRLKENYQYVTWYGDGKDSILGIGAFSKKYELSLAPEYNPDCKFRYVIPYYFYKDNNKIYLFLVWAKTSLYCITNTNKRIPDKHCNLEYVQNVLEAMQHYNNLLNDKIIIIGDFNSGITLDNERIKHDELVKYLEKNNIVNCSLKDKLEKAPTYFHIDKYKNEIPFTDDYCFVSKNIKIESFTIGKKEIYHEYSDHLPIIVNLKI